MPILFCLFAASAAISSKSLASNDSRSVSVSGQCLKKMAPDRGRVTLVAQYLDKSAAVASQKAMKTYEKIREAVKKLNLSDLQLQTSDYSLNENFEYEKNKKISKGMIASIGLEVTTSDISRLGEVTALATTLEVNRVEGLTTFLSDEKAKSARESCLVEAIINARHKAEKMTEASGSKLGEVLVIDENPLHRDFQEAFMEGQEDIVEPRAMMAKQSLAPGIESKPETINVNILVRFAIK